MKKGGRKITLQGAYDKYLGVKEDETLDATALEAGQKGTFELIPRGGNKYAFKSDLNEKYLVAEDYHTTLGLVSARRDKIEAWEEFEVKQTTEGIQKLSSQPW